MSKIAQNVTLRLILAFTICASLLLLPGVSLLSEASQGQGQGGSRDARPRQKKPEGTLPDLEDVKNESNVEREAPPPIPSTMRAKRNEGKPWDGRRVGDPEPPQRQHDQATVIEKRTRRAHARRRVSPPPAVPDDQFVQNFFTWALIRSGSSSENAYWYDQLRAAYGQGQESLKLATIELGRTLFESAEYAARNRDNHWYVYDLYKAYLMREPDAGGWATWEVTAATNGREYVRRGFEESTEFATLLAGMTPNGSATSVAASLISARVDPRNQPGHGMLTRDASWSVPLLSLPGRAGLDLGLVLSYSSMIWTRSGPYIYFDEDNGFPSAGFRLGFPTVQRKAFDVQTARNAYLLLTPGGQRVELRQVGTSNTYDAADSSYLRLTDNGNLVLRSTDGTKLSFTYFNGEYRCTEIKDRNGNYLTVNYNALGQITTVTDTLGRVITFNYDGNANLLSITQAWNGQPSHQWVSFGWSTRTLQPSFTSGAVVGTANGALLPVITQVVLNDTSSFTFDYTNSLQVSVIKNYFGETERNATAFGYETPAGDVPRLLSSSVSAQNWTGVNGVPAQVTTQYSVAGDGACVMTAPDGTVYKEYYGSGWQKGLTTLSEIWSGGVRQKWTTTAWTQDNTSVSYKTNPRVTETNVYDASGNRRRTQIVYTSYNLPDAVALPTEVNEYAADGTTVLRRTATTYFDGGQAYIDRRVLGLLREVIVYDGNNQPQSKVWYDYDWSNDYWESLPQPATQHDASGTAPGRGNLCWTGRWDVTDINNFDKTTRSYVKYNRTGSVIKTEDHLGHGNALSYADSFSDTVNRNTFAYPTTLTDADGNSSTLQYNFDFGAKTRTQSPALSAQLQGAIQTMTYNSLGQLERITTTNNGAYKRFWYGPNYVASYATVNNVADEAYAIQVIDGLGRVIGATSNHPGSYGGYRLVSTIYDQMGRATRVSNPTEINSSWLVSGDDAGGIYYTEQTYDWKGRPLVTINTDSTTKTAAYSGCGCAGGEVVTLTDEGTVDGGVAKRRQQKIYSDVFGRTVKTEILNWQNGSVYSATVNTYNVRDQLTKVRGYAGAEGSGTYQDTIITYDGYGRVKTKHVPEQAAGANTAWDYNADNTIQKLTDGRGATATYFYNGRHLVTGITYGLLQGAPPLTVPGPVTYTYDGASNRTAMNDGTGSTTYTYDSLSRMSSESRSFTGFSGTYALNYSYNLANALTQISIPFKSQQIGYNYDAVGRLSGVTGSGFTATVGYPTPSIQNVTSFASNIVYRAWGGRKSMTYGNTTSEQTSYNGRLQPTTYTLTNMNYTNQNVCCSYPNYSTMTWTYSYYDDGSVKTAWDSTNEWFDRSYTYDHVGRLKDAFTYRRARGLAPYPTNLYPDPYYQNITYDAFNHSSRIGYLYTGSISDTGTYVNNRRTDSGWGYDNDGNNTRDASYQQTYDAAGKLIRAVSHEMVGDNIEYPLQPSLDIAQTYDGNGSPAKRDQISRMFGGVDPYTGNPYPPLEDAQTTYFVRSSVLGGATVAELGGANTVHIYAAGQRIAREEWGNVSFEHHNPVTGSWVTSVGHSSNRITLREERDPRGAELPLSNPYGSTQSYVSMKFAEPMFYIGGDPFDYSSGREIDGVPVSESEFQRRVGNGSVDAGVFIGGRYLGSIDLRTHSSFGVPWTISIRISVFEDVDSQNGLDSSPAPDKSSPGEMIETATTAHGQRWLASMTINIMFPSTQQQSGFVGAFLATRAQQTPEKPPLWPEGKPFRMSLCLQWLLAPYFKAVGEFRGLDLNEINLYDGLPKDKATQTFLKVDAQAITYGNSIYFGPGAYNSSLAGIALMAHELTHVKQFRLHGLMGFGAQYLKEFAANKRDGMNDFEAYSNISFEQEARDYAANVIDAIKKQYGEDPCQKFKP